MQQERLAPQFAQDNTNMNQELREFRKINFSLRKRIKEKDHKIHQLFGCIQDASRQYGQSPEPSLIKSQPPLERYNRLTLSDNRKKQKQNKLTQIYEEGNIFKQPSSHAIGKMTKDELRLPTLKNRNLFSIEEGQDNPEKKGRLVRIAMERLKPLDAEEVRRRFLMKYSGNKE